MSETHYCRDCKAPVLLRDAEGHADVCPSALKARLDAVTEYLNDICDAYEEWKKSRDADSNDSIASGLEDAIEAACDARCEP